MGFQNNFLVFPSIDATKSTLDKEIDIHKETPNSYPFPRINEGKPNLKNGAGDSGNTSYNAFYSQKPYSRRKPLRFDSNRRHNPHSVNVNHLRRIHNEPVCHLPVKILNKRTDLLSDEPTSDPEEATTNYRSSYVMKVQTAEPASRNRNRIWRNPIVPQVTDTESDRAVILLPAVQTRDNPMFDRGGRGSKFPWNALNNKHLNSNDFKTLSPNRKHLLPYDKKESRNIFPKTRRHISREDGINVTSWDGAPSLNVDKAKYWANRFYYS